jgi:membrane fusion protein, macrolide-specific efflux system
VNNILKLSLIKKIILIVLIVGIGWFSFSRISKNKTEEPEYQTAQAQRGTLVTTVTASGTVGPNLETQQQTAAAWASYLSAKNNLDSAKTTLYTLQSASFAANQKFINDAVARELATNDPTYIQQNADWKAAEEKYNNQQNVINQAQASLSSAFLSYKQLSSTIIPSEKHVIINLTEIDVTKVKSGQKVTLTLDALGEKTLTGKVLAVNTNGSVSSGVTTYPATITFDSAIDDIYPNMAANATIITEV